MEYKTDRMTECKYNGVQATENSSSFGNKGFPRHVLITTRLNGRLHVVLEDSHQRECMVCSLQNYKRRHTLYYCDTCPDKPGIHLGKCFVYYHTRIDYGLQYFMDYRFDIEQLERQRAQANYQKLHAAGKTDEARADLARLAIIKQQREEAAKKREAEKKEKEVALQKKTELRQKALGKKS